MIYVCSKGCNRSRKVVKFVVGHLSGRTLSILVLKGGKTVDRRQPLVFLLQGEPVNGKKGEVSPTKILTRVAIQNMCIVCQRG
jgi:hypothetical protein